MDEQVQSMNIPSGTPDQSSQSATFDINADAELSAFANADKTGFDPDKVRALIKEKATIETSRDFFQKSFQSKENIPDVPEKYVEGFKPDSKYEKFMDSDAAKNTIKSITEYAKANNIGKKATQAFIDYALKQQVDANIIDARTEEQKADMIAKKRTEAMKDIEPMLSSMNRSFEENQEVLKQFFEGQSPFVSDPEQRDFLMSVADSSAAGYKHVSMLTEMIRGFNVPIVTGTYDKGDINAMRAELDKSRSPEHMEEIMKKFGL